MTKKKYEHKNNWEKVGNSSSLFLCIHATTMIVPESLANNLHIKLLMLVQLTQIQSNPI